MNTLLEQVASVKDAVPTWLVGIVIFLSAAAFSLPRLALMALAWVAVFGKEPHAKRALAVLRVLKPDRDEDKPSS